MEHLTILLQVVGSVFLGVVFKVQGVFIDTVCGPEGYWIIFLTRDIHPLCCKLLD